jgi:hypothetical protein
MFFLSFSFFLFLSFFALSFCHNVQGSYIPRTLDEVIDAVRDTKKVDKSNNNKDVINLFHLDNVVFLFSVFFFFSNSIVFESISRTDD